MPGEIVALLGVNGAGKSTFLDIVLGLATPTQGDISVYGMSPREAVRRSLVGAMLQTGALPRDGKVRNTIDLVAAMHANPIPTDELLERTTLTKLAKRPLNKLSGGEVQRVRLALALSGNPDFLILDEATAGMDALARRAFWDTMHAEAAEGRTLLFATHYLTEARKEADRIVIIDAGKVLLDAPTEQVVADHADLEDVVERGECGVYDFQDNDVPGSTDRDRDYWRDVGTLDAYYEANMDLISVHPVFNLYNRDWPTMTMIDGSLPPAKFVYGDADRLGHAIDSFVSPGVIVSGGEIIRSIVSPNTYVHSWAKIEDSVIMHGSRIGRSSRVVKTILDKNVIVEEGAVVGVDLEHDLERGFTVTESGITVVPKGTVVHK